MTISLTNACHFCHKQDPGEKLIRPENSIVQHSFHPQCLARWKIIAPENPREKVTRVFANAKEAFALASHSKDPVTHKLRLKTTDLTEEKLASVIKGIDDLYSVFTHCLVPVDVTNTTQRETLYLLLIGLKYGLSIYSELPHDLARINYYFDMYDSLYDLALYFITFEEKTAHLVCNAESSSLSKQKFELKTDRTALGILRIKINNRTKSTLDLMLKNDEVYTELCDIKDNKPLRLALSDAYGNIGKITPPEWKTTNRLESLKAIHQVLLIFKQMLTLITVECLLKPDKKTTLPRLIPAATPKVDLNCIYTNTRTAFTQFNSLSKCQHQAEFLHVISTSHLSLQNWREEIDKFKKKTTSIDPTDRCAINIIIERIDRCLACMDFAKSFILNPRYRQYTTAPKDSEQLFTKLQKLCSENAPEETYCALFKKEQFDDQKTCILMLQHLIAWATQATCSRQNFFPLFHFLCKNISCLNFFNERYALLPFLEYEYANYALDEADKTRPNKALCDELHVTFSIFFTCILNFKSNYDKRFIDHIQSCAPQLLSYFASRHTTYTEKWIQEQNPSLSQDQIKSIESLKSTVYAFVSALSRQAALCHMNAATEANYAERYTRAPVHEVHNPIEVIAEWALLIENTRNSEQLQILLKKMLVILSMQQPSLYSEQLLTVRHAITGALTFYQRSPVHSAVPSKTVRFFDLPCDAISNVFKMVEESGGQPSAEIEALKNSSKSEVIRDFTAHIVVRMASLSHLETSPPLAKRLQNHEAAYYFLKHIIPYRDAVDNFYHLKLYYTLLQEYLTTIQAFLKDLTDAQLIRFEEMYHEFYIQLIYSRCKQANISPHIPAFESALGALELEICKSYQSAYTYSTEHGNTNRANYFYSLVSQHVNSLCCTYSKIHQPSALVSALHIAHWFYEKKLPPAPTDTLHTFRTALTKNTIDALTKGEDRRKFFTGLIEFTCQTPLTQHYIALFNCSRALTQTLPPLSGQPSLSTEPLPPKQFLSHLREVIKLFYADNLAPDPCDTIQIQKIYQETLEQPGFYANLLSSCQETIYENDLQVRIELLHLILHLGSFHDAQNASYRSLLITILTDLLDLNKKYKREGAKQVLLGKFNYYYPLYVYVSSFIKHHPSCATQKDKDLFASKKELFSNMFLELNSIDFSQASGHFFSEIIRICFSLPQEPSQIPHTHNTQRSSESQYLLDCAATLHPVTELVEVALFLQKSISATKATLLEPLLTSTWNFLLNQTHSPTELALPECALNEIIERVKDVSPGNQTKAFGDAVISAITADFDDPTYINKMFSLLSKKTHTLTPQQLQNIIVFMNTRLNVKHLWRTPDFIHLLSALFSKPVELKEEKTQSLAALFLHMTLYAMNHPKGFNLGSIQQSAMTLMPKPTSKTPTAQNVYNFQIALPQTLAKVCYGTAQALADSVLLTELKKITDVQTYLKQLQQITHIHHKNTFIEILGLTILFLEKHTVSNPILKTYILQCTIALDFCQTFEKSLPYDSKTLQTTLPQNPSETPAQTAPPSESPAKKAQRQAVIAAKNKAAVERQKRLEEEQLRAKADLAAINELLANKRNGLSNIVLPEDPSKILAPAPRAIPQHLLTTPQERHELRKAHTVDAAAALKDEESTAYQQRQTRFIQEKAYNSPHVAQPPKDIIVPLENIPPIFVPPAALSVLEAFTGNAFISGGYPAAYMLNTPPNDIDIMCRCTPKQFAPFAAQNGFVQSPKKPQLFIRHEPGELDIDVYCYPENTPIKEIIDKKDVTLTGLVVTHQKRICDPAGVLGDFDKEHLTFFGDLRTLGTTDPITLLRALRYSYHKKLRTEDEQVIAELLPRLVPAIQSGQLPFAVYLKQLQALFLRGTAQWFFTEKYTYFAHLLPFSNSVFNDPYIKYCQRYMNYVFEDFDTLCHNKDVRDKFHNQLLAILILPQILTGKSPKVIISELCATLSNTDRQQRVLESYLTYHRTQYFDMLENLKEIYSYRLLIAELEKLPSKETELLQAKLMLAQLETTYEKWRKELTKTIHSCTEPSSVIFSATSAAASSTLH